MKPDIQPGSGGARRIVVVSRLVVPAWLASVPVAGGLLLPAGVVAENPDPLAEARAVMAQRRDESEQRRVSEDPGAWSKLTNRGSLFQRGDERQPQAPRGAQGPSPYNPKFGAPSFQMPSTPSQDATAPQLKQFHPTAEPGAEGKGRRFLSRGGEAEDACPEDAERRANAAEEGRKSTLSYAGEDPMKDKRRTYDDIYQSKSPYALPSFQMPAGPAAALAAPGAQTWGGRVLTQYRPETEAKGLERARMQREQRAEEKDARREAGPSGMRDLFDRTKKLEGR